MSINRIVVSQPMYFPWIGQLQQVGLCDAFVFYDDVQFSRGFFNRVQIKTKQGPRWLTVPLMQWKRGQLICEVEIDNSQDWMRSHRDQLKQAYSGAPFYTEMIALVDEVFSHEYTVIGELAERSLTAMIGYYSQIAEGTRFLRSSELGITGESSQRLIDICSLLNGTHYLTGHGARNYLNHAAFDEKGIAVEYIDYELDSYPQPHGEFTPYVSALDMIANCGGNGVKLIRGRPVHWRNFITSSATT